MNPYSNELEPIKEFGIEKVDPVKYPEFFADGSILSGLDTTTTPVYMVANAEEINLKDSVETWETNKVLEMKILRCK